MRRNALGEPTFEAMGEMKGRYAPENETWSGGSESASRRTRGGSTDIGSASERRQVTVPIASGAGAPTQEAHGFAGGPSAATQRMKIRGRPIIQRRRGHDCAAPFRPRSAEHHAEYVGVRRIRRTRVAASRIEIEIQIASMEARVACEERVLGIRRAGVSPQRGAGDTVCTACLREGSGAGGAPDICVRHHTDCPAQLCRRCWGLDHD
jgi:hypothetical protein